MPDFTSGRTMPPPDDVDAHPDGANELGIMDLVLFVYNKASIYFTQGYFFF